jgi:hypothetical protein
LIYSGDDDDELDGAGGKDWGDLGKRNFFKRRFFVIRSF